MKKTRKPRLNLSLPIYRIEKPRLEVVDRQKIITYIEKNPAFLRGFIDSANEPKYIYWDKFKYIHKNADLSLEEKWYLVTQSRDLIANPTPIKSENGEYFKWVRLPSTDEFLHRIDMLAGGQLFPHSDLLSQQNQQRYINRGIIEEAIASSQLEGAHTTRKVARRMIIEKREPTNTSEQMIMNNYKAITLIEEEYKKQPLTKELLFELHRVLTTNTIDVQGLNRLRNDKDKIVVDGYIGAEKYITHIPPKERFLNLEVEKLIKYANDEDGGRFVHPIIKAIFIHFWIGYLHPFVDGNGRLARALFYWYLLRKNYWIFMYLPISTAIKVAYIKYPMAFIYSEQDSYDITYFYDFHIKKILLALNDFQDYIDKKVDENREVDRVIEKGYTLNDRQKQLLHYMLSDSTPSTSVTSQSTIYSITRQTAARDLKELEKYGLLAPKREGKYIKYYPTEQLKKLI